MGSDNNFQVSSNVILSLLAEFSFQIIVEYNLLNIFWGMGRFILWLVSISGYITSTGKVLIVNNALERIWKEVVLT
jgi:hypothetical protein